MGSKDETGIAVEVGLDGQVFEATAQSLETRLADLESLARTIARSSRPFLIDEDDDLDMNAAEQREESNSLGRLLSSPSLPGSPASASLSIGASEVQSPPRAPSLVFWYPSANKEERQQARENSNPLYFFSKVWFSITALIALIAAVLTTVEFASNIRNPLGAFAVVERATEDFPIVTICPRDLAVPYFPEHTVAFPSRRIHDLYYFRLLDGTSCASQPGSCFDDYVESGWLSQNSSIDCGAEFKEFSVAKFSSDRLFSLPCRYCFRIGFIGDTQRNTTESYLSKTETLQMQLSEEYFQCMLQPGGISRKLLGDGRTRGSLNYEIKQSWRDKLREGGTLIYDSLQPDEDADLPSVVMCNVLFFSGFFFPADNSSRQIVYEWSGSEWLQVTQGPYFELRTTVTNQYTLGYELYFQSVDQVQADFPFISSEVTSNQELQRIDEAAGLPGNSRLLDAPMVTIGAFDMSFISLTKRIAFGNASFSWRMNSFPVFVPPESPHTNNIEYGLNALVNEELYYQSNANLWAWLENCFGWIGTFTGLSFFTTLRKPMSKRIRRIRDAVIRSRYNESSHGDALAIFSRKRRSKPPSSNGDV